MPRSPKQQARTLYRAGKYLSAFHQFGDGLTTKEIGRALGIPLPTAERWNGCLGIAKQAPYKGLKSKVLGHEARFIKLNETLNDFALARRFGVTKSSVMRWRRNLALPTKHKGKWTRTKHPKGMHGKYHSEAMKWAACARMKALWADKSTIFHSKEFLKRRGKAVSMARPIGWMGTNSYSRCKRGKREDLGEIFFRSAWEANVARWLNYLKSLGTILDWQYEAKTFWFEKIRRGVRSYTPDFWITEPSGDKYFIEVKGWMDAKSKTKLKRMAKYHPLEKIIIIDSKEYRKLVRMAGNLPNWEK